MDFGAQLRAWRVEADMSQRDLARRAGIDFTYLSKIETGLVGPPPAERIRSLVSAMGRGAEDAEMLIELAARIRVPSTEVKAALIKHPEMGALLRRIRERPLTPDEADLIRRMADGSRYRTTEEDTSE